MSVSKYPKIVGYSKINDRVRESQRNIRSNRPVAGRGIIIRETSGGTVISVDQIKGSGNAGGAAVWL